jgi:hypothetical protein
MLERQWSAAGDASKVMFVAGDLDSGGRPDDARGRQRLVVQEGVVTRAGATMAARPAESVTTWDVGTRLRVVALDSSTLMAFVDAARGERILMALDEAVGQAAADGRLVLLAAHHPLVSFGPHGRGSAWGSPILRHIHGARRASNHPDYEGYTARLLDRLDRWRRRDAPTKNTVLAFISAHDASLQVIEAGDLFHVVSGSAARATRVWDERQGLSRMRYAHAQPGFIVIQEEPSGAIRLDVVEAHVASSAPPGAQCRALAQLPSGRVGCRTASMRLADPRADPSLGDALPPADGWDALDGGGDLAVPIGED